MSTASIAHRAGGVVPTSGAPKAIAQHEIVELLLGATHVRLDNFLPAQDDEPAKLPAGVSAVSIEAGEMTPHQVEQEVAIATMRARRRSRRALVLGAGVLGLAVLLMGFFGSRLLGAVLSEPTVAPWRVVKVLDSSVLVQVGPTAGGALLQVPAGSLLPDGSTLVSVDAARQIYSTPDQDVRVRGSQGNP